MKKKMSGKKSQQVEAALPRDNTAPDEACGRTELMRRKAQRAELAAPKSIEETSTKTQSK